MNSVSACTCHLRGYSHCPYHVVVNTVLENLAVSIFTVKSLTCTVCYMSDTHPPSRITVLTCLSSMRSVTVLKGIAQNSILIFMFIIYCRCPLLSLWSCSYHIDPTQGARAHTLWRRVRVLSLQGGQRF
jgi:hypothetical protein